MRKVRYTVAATLDGFIAGPNGEIDWIVQDSEFDFNALYAQFDVALIGRHTYEWMRKHGEEWMPPMETHVFSRTLRQEDYPKVKISRDVVSTTRALLEKEGKDIWIFGGGILFRELLDANLVDTVEVALMPAVIGDGIPLLPPPHRTTKLRLTKLDSHPSGVISLEYAVVKDDEGPDGGFSPTA